MDPVQFQCGHCGNVMAVAAENLGQQVQCPHCQQVVIAPMPAAEAPPTQIPAPVVEAKVSHAAPTHANADMTFNVPPPADEESIFSEASQGSEDLFGADRPRIELPPEPAAPEPAVTSAPVSVGNEEAGWGPEETQQRPAVADGPHTNGASDPGLTVEVLWPATPAPATPETPSGHLGSPFQAPMVRAPAKRTWMMPVLVVPLISYAILITLAAGYLWMRLQQTVHPLEALPDQGENQGATHGKTSGMLEKIPTPDQELPAKLRVALGRTIRIGDLEVTPTQVARRRIRFQQGDVVDPVELETLALDLRLRNVSEDVHFKPLDPYFERRWKPSKPAGINMPYTFLTLGEKRFYGGPLDWQPRSRDAARLLVEGQDHDKELGPGEELTTFLCTDPEDKATAVLDKLKDNGPFLWRMQVRRGLVTVKDHEVPATAVIGVEFHRDDVR